MHCVLQMLKSKANMSNLPTESHDHVKTDAEVIDDMVSKAKSFFEEHGNRVVLYLIIAIMVVGGLTFYYNSENTVAAQAWQQLEQAQSPEELASVAQNFSGNVVAVWAKLQEAERRSAQGGQMMLIDRENAIAELQLGQEAYEAVLSNSLAPDEARERSLIGLARVAESLSAEDLSVAVAAYETLLKEFPDTPYKGVATKQIAYLQTEDAKTFYNWFAKQNPVPATIEEPKEGMTPSGGSSAPTLDLGLDAPADSKEEDGPLLTAPGEEMTEEKSEATEPEPAEEVKEEAKPEAKTEAKAADQAKEEVKPAADSKAEEAKPEETKPAETEKPAEEQPKQGNAE